MKFRRFLARHVPGFQFKSISDAPGARGGRLVDASSDPLPPYEGPYDQHVLMLVMEGVIVFERQGTYCEARAGDALLIARGEEGRLAIHPGPESHRVIVDVMVFDERSMARVLRSYAVWESLAVNEWEEPATALRFRGFGVPELTGLDLPLNSFIPALTQLLRQVRMGLPGFLREHFYLRRWQLCIFLEDFVTMIDGAYEAGEAYPHGADQFRIDCLLYLGARPETVLTKRRCELASAWLRCHHSIEDVAQALGYESQWEFECAFSGVTKTRCRDLQELTPLPEVNVDDLCAAIRPFWWESRVLSIDEPPPERLFSDALMSEAEEESMHRAEPEFHAARERNRQARLQATEELRALAADFFAMRCTGARLIVPIFELAPAMEKIAPAQSAAA